MSTGKNEKSKKIKGQKRNLMYKEVSRLQLAFPSPRGNLYFLDNE